MEKETKVTAEEPTTNKILEDNTWRVYGQTFCTLCDNGATSAMLRPVVRNAMHEFADLKCAPLISQLELQENYNDMLVKELEILNQQYNKMAKALDRCETIINNAANMAESSVLKNAILLSLSSLNLNNLLTNYKQTKH